MMQLVEEDEKGLLWQLCLEIKLDLLAQDLQNQKMMD